METKNYELKNGESRSLPPLSGTALLKEAGADELRVLWCLCERGGGNAETLSVLTGLDTATVESALAFWRGAGVVSLSSAEKGENEPNKPSVTPKKPKRKQELSEKNAEELAESIKERSLASLIEAAEAQCGRVFNSHELSILVGLTEELGLDSAYILTLLAYCDGDNGDKKPLRYAERVAFRLYELGIDTYEALEEYIEKQTRMRSLEGRLRSMFGIGSRRLSVKEEKAFMSWCCEYGYGEELIGAAYDVTVNATGQASVSYAGKILSHWHECGIKTVEEAEALLQKEREDKSAKGRRAGKKPEPPKDALHSSFEDGDFFRRALARSYKNDRE